MSEIVSRAFVYLSGLSSDGEPWGSHPNYYYWTANPKVMGPWLFFRAPAETTTAAATRRSGGGGGDFHLSRTPHVSHANDIQLLGVR